MSYYTCQNTHSTNKDSFTKAVSQGPSSATKLNRVDMLSHPIKDYFGLTNIEGMMDAIIRVNHYSGKAHQ